MRRAYLLLLVYLSAIFLLYSAKAQTPGGLVKRTPEKAEQMRQAGSRVTLDVQVTDASGKPVRGLEQQDFTLLDNGNPTALTSFQELGGSSTTTAPVEVILLLDTMNATFQDVVIERQGMETFLRQNGGHLALPVSIVFLADTGVKLGKPSQDGNLLAEDLRKLPTPMRIIGSEQGAEGAQDRAQRSLRALQVLSTYEATRPGRKLLIWVGPGWPLLSRSTAELSAKDRSRYFNSIVDVTTDLRRAHTTLYSVAPLNLAQVGGQNPHFWETFLNGVENPGQADSQNLALQVLAVHSGGLALALSGDLAGQITRCMADGQDYYEMSLDAAAGNSAMQYRALQVKLGRAGNAARTATGYYAGVSQSTSELPPTASTSSPSPTEPAPHLLAAEARLVVVDVTALDKKGLPIKGLSTYFSLREDGVPQKIVSVEEHSTADHSIPAAPMDGVPDGTIIASNKPPA